LYVQRINGLKCKIDIAASCALEGISVKAASVLLQMQQLDTGKLFSVHTEAVVFGTGYKYCVPDFLEPVHKMIRWQTDDLYDVQPNYSIDFHDRVFVQNAELHTHGFNSADLGLGPYRNGVILNTILGREFFKMENGKTRY
jgi:lysine N6-hydroxylase